MLESSIENRLKKEIEKLGGKALKFVSPGIAGVPDRIVLLPYGKAIFVELKAPGKKLRPIQELRKKELEKLGFDYWVVDSYKEIEDLLVYIKVQEY
ncbi:MULTISPECIES: VRR-NUC domain-containing protein [Clostridium]|uniref:VRR-NUC domain-containing protein n=1 Tax=Clostridium faecium TaxID=2762223 RepID=A0ABR8YR82_9CLOT|nr:MULTISPECIES: VRR-NUC domain-containing protein [Clostridium]MBD8046772.1 VRR-NUC domain-containing protein [Clostridium faecium]